MVQFSLFTTIDELKPFSVFNKHVSLRFQVSLQYFVLYDYLNLFQRRLCEKNAKCLLKTENSFKSSVVVNNIILHCKTAF